MDNSKLQNNAIILPTETKANLEEKEFVGIS